MGYMNVDHHSGLMDHVGQNVMTNHTIACLFAGLFGQLLEDKVIDAKLLWEMSKDYDFNPHNIVYEEEAKKLGLLEEWKALHE